MTAVVQFAQVSSLNTTFFFPWGFCALFGLFTNDHCLALILLSPVKGRKASWFPLTPLYTEAQESLNLPTVPEVHCFLSPCSNTATWDPVP